MSDSGRQSPIVASFVGGGLLVGMVTGVILLIGSEATTIIAGAALEGITALLFLLFLTAPWWLARRFLAPLATEKLPAKLQSNADFLAGATIMAVLPFFASQPLIVPSIIALAIAAPVGIGLRRLGRWVPGGGVIALFALLVLSVPMLGGDTVHPTYPLAGPPANAPIPDADSPNILLVSIDTLRADCLDTERDGTALMPNLRALAAEGKTVEAWASSNQTGPTHTSLYTGRGILEHPVNQNGIPLPESITTTAELFSALGWDTRGVISNPLLAGTMGLARGFHAYDDRLVRDSPFEMSFRSLMRVSPRMQFSSNMLWRILPKESVRGLFIGGVAKDKRRGSLVVQHATDLLDTAATDRPWFLLAHFLDPHGPYEAPEGYRYRFAAEDGGGIGATPMPLSFKEDRLDPLSAEERAPLIEEFHARYDEEVLYTDYQLGRLLEMVKARTGDRPLWIVVTSDHGEHFMEHDEIGHSTTAYEELMRAVMVISGPQVEAYANLPRISEEVGPFLLDVATGSNSDPRIEPMLVQGYKNILCANEGGWKLVLQADEPYGIYEPIALYHLAEDPGEFVDLLDSEPEKVTELMSSLESRRDRDRPFAKTGMREDADMQAILQEMGYVH